MLVCSQNFSSVIGQIFDKGFIDFYVLFEIVLTKPSQLRDISFLITMDKTKTEA